MDLTDRQKTYLTASTGGLLGGAALGATVAAACKGAIGMSAAWGALFGAVAGLATAALVDLAAGPVG